MANLLEDTQRLVGDADKIQFVFFADEGSSGTWVYSRWIDFIWLVGSLMKTGAARPRLVAVTDRSIVLMRGGTIPRTWGHPQEVLDVMPLDTPVSGQLTGSSSYINVGKHRLWVKSQVYPYVERLGLQVVPA